MTIFENTFYWKNSSLQSNIANARNYCIILTRYIDGSQYVKFISIPGLSDNGL